MKYVFGPVSSRRLGRSLGVDLVRAKTCSQDCLYCEAGATTRLTLERREYVPAAAVLAELKAVLDLRPELDSVTFSGAGEPTLHSKIGEILRFLKREYPGYTTTVLTNGALLDDPAVRAELAAADRVVPSLDATDEAEFRRLNRPAPGLTLERLIAGLRAFGREYRGEIDLECFIAPGINDSAESLERLREILRTVRFDRLQLNTLDRPGVDPALRPAPPETMLKLVRSLRDLGDVEAIGRFRYRPARPGADAPPGVSCELECRLVELALRRPITAADAAEALEIAPELAARMLENLAKKHTLRRETGERGIFYGGPAQ